MTQSPSAHLATVADWHAGRALEAYHKLKTAKNNFWRSELTREYVRHIRIADHIRALSRLAGLTKSRRKGK